MKKLFFGLLFSLSTLRVLAVDAAYDVLLTQRKDDNSGNIQRNVTAVANGVISFDASKHPTSTLTPAISILGNAATVTTNANLTGDVTSVGNATTLASVATAGTTGSSTSIPVITIDVKGRTNGITTAAVVAPAGTLTGSTLASGVTASSLVSGAGGAFGTAAYTAASAYATAAQGTKADNAGAVTGAIKSNGSATFAQASASDLSNGVIGTGAVVLATGNAATATTATNATNTAITDDTTTNATMYPTWVTAATGNLPQKVSSTKFSFNPSAGLQVVAEGIGAAPESRQLYVTGVDPDGLGPSRVLVTTDNTFVGCQTWLAPNLTAGHEAFVAVGKASSTNDWAGFAFGYAGSGSTSNYLSYSFYGGSSVFKVTAAGAATFAGPVSGITTLGMTGAASISTGATGLAMSLGTGASADAYVALRAGTFSGIGYSGGLDAVLLGSGAGKNVIIYAGQSAWGTGTEAARFTTTGIQGAIGATTPSTGAFTTLSASGLISAPGYVSTTNIYEGTTNALSAVSINYFGYNQGTTQFRIFRVYDGKNNLITETSSTGLAVTGLLSTTYAGAGPAVAIKNSDDTSNSIFTAFQKSDGTTIGSVSRVTTTNAVVYTTTSDARLKTNFRDFTASGKIIDGLRPRIFDWKDSKTDDGKNAVGFIAQEENAVDPMLAHIGAVTVGDADPDKITKQWQRSDAALIPILVAEIKALRARVSALEKK